MTSSIPKIECAHFWGKNLLLIIERYIVLLEVILCSIFELEINLHRR